APIHSAKRQHSVRDNRAIAPTFNFSTESCRVEPQQDGLPSWAREADPLSPTTVPCTIGNVVDPIEPSVPE
ncbi:hypothetical protein, partial [Acinetobacter nosocomialis]|uniref:hypothetical protein n=1 Tax=Acinetobacter nosocomialis TaxID=106654 RepID=UPI001C0A54F1